MKRLASLDALRGFDMFFITGGAGLIGAIASLCCGKECWLFAQMEHVWWAGFHHHDTIFPLFLFLAGVSWPFSLASQREKGRSDGRIYLKILIRTAILFVLGMSLGGVFAFHPHFRIPSVLGFIGISWGVSAVIFMNVDKVWKRAAVIAAFVLGYFALLHFCSFPGAFDSLSPDAMAKHLSECGLTADQIGYSKQCNIIRYFDLKLMPNHLLMSFYGDMSKMVPPFCTGFYDPESLTSVPGGIIIALIGMCTGALLRSERFAAAKKAGILFGCSLASFLLALFFIYALNVPMVKALWTVSFDFASLTYSFAMLAIFFTVVDVLGFRKWTILFDPVGKNSILVYMFGNMGIWGAAHKFFFGGLSQNCGDFNGIVWNVTYYGTALLVAWYLREKKVFLKV